MKVLEKIVNIHMTYATASSKLGIPNLKIPPNPPFLRGAFELGLRKAPLSKGGWGDWSCVEN